MLCLHFLGNLAASLGSVLCFEVEKCVDLRLFLEELLKLKKEALSAEELLITLPSGAPVPAGSTICDVSEVYVLRLVRGG